MTAVDYISRKREIYRSALDFLKSLGYGCKIFRIIDLGTEPVLNVKSLDIAHSVKLI